MIGILLAAAIELTGVTGTDLRARAFFDANNVKVGDPLVLTVDFLGEADFRALHPPALARRVNAKDWKLDDVSAKTETYRDARRLTYRVRPMREGVLWFPALEFGYVTPSGEARTVRANEIPVHAKGGAQVEVAEMSEDTQSLPAAPFVAADCADARLVPDLTEEERFFWQKACAARKADGFVGMDFPGARLNEAACAVAEGNWARALKIYQRLEWRLGQTPEIERGIVAALAVRYDNPLAELPVWRQVARPLLRYGWQGRIGLVVGALALVVLLFWLIGRGLRAVACVAVALLLVPTADAQGIFQQMEEEMQRMRQRMQSMSSGFSFHFGEKEEREPVRIAASVETAPKNLQVGTPFTFLVSIEAPRTCSVGQVRLIPSETFGLTVTGRAENLPDGKGTNPSNVVHRLSVPVRYDVPFKGKISFSIEGMVTGRQTRGSNFSFTFSNSFSCQTPEIPLEIRPLATAGQPPDFGGVISEGLSVHELPDLLTLETNDVIQITYRMRTKGYVPATFLPAGAAFEMNRDPQDGTIEYRRFFVADGAPTTPKFSVSYYDPRTKTYRRAEAGGTPLRYVPTR